MAGKNEGREDFVSFWMFYLLDQMDGLIPTSAFPMCLMSSDERKTDAHMTLQRESSHKTTCVTGT